MYTISEAANRAGVTPDVLRAWERRYQIVEPRRASSGYRQYDEAAIRRVRAMRRMVEDGWTPSAAAESLRDVVDADLSRRRGAAQRLAPSRRMLTTSVTVSSGRQPIWNRPPFRQFSTRWALARRSRRWWTDTSSRRSRRWAMPGRRERFRWRPSTRRAPPWRWIGAAYDAAGRNRPDARPILVGLPSGARHELAALAFATAARRAGLTVQYIGADVPAAEWVRAARATNASAAVIGVPTATDAPAARAVVASLRRALPDLLVTLGGDGARGMQRQSVLPRMLPDAVRELQALLADRTSAA